MGSHYKFSIMYDLPDNVYSRFICFMGLHADFYKRGDVKVQLVNDGEIVFEGRFNKSHPAQKIDLEDPRGHFGLIGSSDEKNVNDIFVWAAPVLERKDAV